MVLFYSAALLSANFFYQCVACPVRICDTCVKWTDLQFKHTYEYYVRYVPEKEFPFASRLKAVREFKGITIEEISNELGISVEQWAEYENGISVMTIEELIHFSKYIKKAIYSFFTVHSSHFL